MGLEPGEEGGDTYTVGGGGGWVDRIPPPPPPPLCHLLAGTSPRFLQWFVSGVTGGHARKALVHCPVGWQELTCGRAMRPFGGWQPDAISRSIIRKAPGRPAAGKSSGKGIDFPTAIYVFV